MSYEPRLLRHNQNYVNVMVVTKRILRFLQRYFFTDLVESDGSGQCGRPMWSYIFVGFESTCHAIYFLIHVCLYIIYDAMWYGPPISNHTLDG